MWQTEHSSSIAAFDSAWSIASRLTLACQYGSRDEFAIMLARQSKPMDTSSPDAVTRPLWHATHRSDVRNSTVAAFRPEPAPALASNATTTAAAATTTQIRQLRVIATRRADHR